MTAEELLQLCRKAAHSVHKRFNYSRRLDIDELVDIAFLAVASKLDYRTAPERQTWSCAYLNALRYAYRELKRPPGLNYGAEKSDLTTDDFLRAEYNRSCNLKKDCLDDIDLLLDIQEALNRLPKSDKAILKKYFNESLSYREIGDDLSISPQSVFCRVQAVLDVLRFTLRSYNRR